MAGSQSNQLDHLFRHQSGKMVAVLTRIFGLSNLQLAEDVVQEAFLKAIDVWMYERIPENPSAWLMRVARNKAIDLLRRKGKELQSNMAEVETGISTAEEMIDDFFLENEIADSQLRMIFTCSHPLLKEEDQLALTLKIVSGFSAQEIAHALLTSEDAIQKRLYRAKDYIRKENIEFIIPSGLELNKRLHIVLSVLYLMFNEGYNSVNEDELIRTDICAEAMRLAKLLTEHKICNKPECSALLSLMCFHAARFESRLDDSNDIILLQDQDRTKWNKELIKMGTYYLNLSADGDDFSVYHLESAIAAEHCITPSFQQTNWERLLQIYDMLLQMKPSPIVQLNKAVVLAQSGKIVEAINYVLLIEQIESLLNTQYIYAAVLGDFYKQLSDEVRAKKFLQQAYRLTTSRAEKKLISDKLNCFPENNN